MRSLQPCEPFARFSIRILHVLGNGPLKAQDDTARQAKSRMAHNSDASPILQSRRQLRSCHVPCGDFICSFSAYLCRKPERAIALLGKISTEDRYMISDRARQRAEKSFRQEERAREGRQAMAEYEARARAIREKTARLKALRLAKEAEARNSNTNGSR